MNEVASFVKGGINGCADNKLNYPPFTPSESQMHLQLDLFIGDASVSSASVDIHPHHFHSTLQESSMTWCTVRPCAWMLNTSGGTTMMSTVCMGTLWSWPLMSKCWFIHILYANDLCYDWLMLLSSLVRWLMQMDSHMWPWTTKPVLSRWSIFVAIANNTLYGSKLYIFLFYAKNH